jgi:hypothetical protein
MSDADATGAEVKEQTAAFAPKPGQRHWWSGDPEQIARHPIGAFHRSFVSKRHVLSATQCRILIDCFERNREACAAKDVSDYWDGRFMWQNSLPETETDAIRIMQQLRFLCLMLLNQAVVPDEPLYSDTAQLVRWHEGIELPPHADNIEPDGRPNISPHRSFSSLVYLNDDFEGGETYFPGHRIRFAPEAGGLVLFGAGPEYIHGVTRVRRGLRYTYAGWFTYEKTREDFNAPRVF